MMGKKDLGDLASQIDFILKKIIGWVISPLGLFFGLVALVVVSRLCQKQWKSWHIAVTFLACTLLFMFSWPPTAQRLIASLESPYYVQFYEKSLSLTLLSLLTFFDRFLRFFYDFSLSLSKF